MLALFGIAVYYRTLNGRKWYKSLDAKPGSSSTVKNGVEAGESVMVEAEVNGGRPV